METKGQRERRSYKGEVVALCRSPGSSVSKVARDLDLTETAVRRWVAQAEVDSGRAPGADDDGAGGAQPPAPGEPPAARGAGPSEAGGGFLRQGDPLSRYRFVAAEKQAARAVTRACAGLEVSRSAYYQWSMQRPSQRAVQDAAQGQRIAGIHAESRGTYGSPRVHRQLHREGVACGRKRVARLMTSRGLAGRQSLCKYWRL